jgi:uncharacterized protein (TIGR03435 family)
VPNLRFSILVVMGTGLALCQTEPSFEVASIRLNQTRGRGSIEFPPGGERFVATNVPLAALIVTAYGITAQQCSCDNPAIPVLLERFDIQADAGRSVSRVEMTRLLQTLLKERFHLDVQREKKDFQAYALVVDKRGPHLRPSDVAHERDVAPLNPYHARGTESGGGHLSFTDETMPELAFRLSTLTVLDRIVVDQTGLSGHYDFELNYDPRPGRAPTEAQSPSDDPSIFTALREQLGLSLQEKRIPLDAIRVEHADRPSEN